MSCTEVNHEILKQVEHPAYSDGDVTLEFSRPAWSCSGVVEAVVIVYVQGCSSRKNITVLTVLESWVRRHNRRKRRARHGHGGHLLSCSKTRRRRPKRVRLFPSLSSIKQILQVGLCICVYQHQMLCVSPHYQHSTQNQFELAAVTCFLPGTSVMTRM